VLPLNNLCIPDALRFSGLRVPWMKVKIWM
jgi:hypothetical protein